MERLARRRVLGLAACASALPAISRIAFTQARAQAYPTRPVRIVVGFPAGGSTDITARVMAQWLSQQLGQQFLIENRPGAAGNLATESVAHSPPDGYTLLMATAANAISGSLYDKLSFNFIHDIAPVAEIIRIPNLMTVHPSVPAHSVSEFIAYAKGNPGKINMASGGSGTSPHLSGELFKMLTGVSMVHVPYRGDGPALTDLVAGQVQVLFGNMPASLQHVRTGRLRALAVTTRTRAEALPDVPAMSEIVPGYEASAFIGVCAPANTPHDIVARLNAEINAGLADPATKARLVELGGTVSITTPAEFGKFIAEETEKWAKVVKFSGAKPE
jgi:tripartite-type tricarboxylate transporter receptor subunit TctC